MFRGYLVGYKGENGYIFKVQNLVIKEIVCSRDITFPNKLNKNRDNDLKGGVVLARKLVLKDLDLGDNNTGALYKDRGLVQKSEKGKLSF